MRQHLAVFVQERANCGEQSVELLYRVGQLLIGAGQVVGELGQVGVQRDELLVIFVQGVDEKRQAVCHREEVATALVQRGQRPRQAVQRGVDLLALAGQPIGVRLDDLAERALGLLGRRAEFGDDVGDAAAKLVPLRRHLSAFDRDHRVVGQHRTTFVRWLQLNAPRRHQGGVEDHRRRVGGHLVFVGVVEGHLHLVAGRLDLVDGAHPNAHDLDPVAGIQGVGRREVGHHSVIRELLVQLEPNEREGQAPAQRRARR